MTILMRRRKGNLVIKGECASLEEVKAALAEILARAEAYFGKAT